MEREGERTGGGEERRRRRKLTRLFRFGLGLGWGVGLQRIGMDSLGSFEGMSVPALMWSQGIGCAFFGLILGKREELYFM